MIQKFGPKTRRGIFAGYHMHNGGKWSGDYLVVDADAFTSTPSSKSAYVHRVKEITHDGLIVFPVKMERCNNPIPSSRNANKQRRTPCSEGRTTTWLVCPGT